MGLDRGAQPTMKVLQWSREISKKKQGSFVQKLTKINPKILQYVLIAIPTFVYFYYFLNKCLVIYDEGYILEASRLVHLGKVPYRDFYFQYTPLTVWLGAFWFKIFGVGIIKLRWLALLISLASITVGYTIASKIFVKSIAIMVTFGLIAWGFPHTNFLWPSAVAILFLFLLIYSLIKFTETHKSSYLFLSGVLVALSLLTKQNLGVANLVGSIAYIFYLRLRNKSVINYWWFLAGFFPIFIYSIFNLSINPQNISGFREFFSRSLEVAAGKTLFAPYPIIINLEMNLKGVLKYIGKSFIYLFPLVLYITSAFFAVKKRPQEKVWYLIFFLTSLHFFALMWPISDLAHLTFGVPALILMVAGFSLFNYDFWKKISKVLLVILMLIGFYKTFFMRYYTFETPYLLQTKETIIKEERFYLDEKYFVIVNGLSELKTSLFKGKTVFAHSYMPMFYYLIDQTSPTYDLYTVHSLLSTAAQRKVISELKEKKIDFVIFETWRENNSPNLITKYIKDNYKKIDEIWDYDVLERI